MCGIAGMFGDSPDRTTLESLIAAQRHRGPDSSGIYEDPDGGAVLGNTRLSIVDTTDAGSQPMSDPDGRYHLTFNGEIYNYKELRAEIGSYPFRTQTDTEVLLAAYARWGEACLDRLIGMFAFVVWDSVEKRMFAARDRFGVKPFHFAVDREGGLLVTSEIRVLQSVGVGLETDERTWAGYLVYGSHDPRATFWRGIERLPAGHTLTWQNGSLTQSCWYDLLERVGDGVDGRGWSEVEEQYLSLLEDSVRLRFRSDVPVGINLSGGLDSSTLLGIVERVHPNGAVVPAYTFAAGDERYDETPYVSRMLTSTQHPSFTCLLDVEEVPGLAAAVHDHHREPYGGIPTLAYARLFEFARAEGTVVLLDGQGMDEQWGGYDYYRHPDRSTSVQGTRDAITRPECLDPDFRALAEPPAAEVEVSADRLRNLQLRDIRYTKIPRALRYNDAISMMSSVELREPFLDQRLVELSLRQPSNRKIDDGVSKVGLRHLGRRYLREFVTDAPKRPVQTPQREWLRGPLAPWVRANVDRLSSTSAWFVPGALKNTMDTFIDEGSDNSFFVWQWLDAAALSTK